MVGTVDYIAPEQIERDDVDARADVYGLGCVLFECLTGQVPFPHDSDLAVLWAHMRLDPPRPSALNPELQRVSKYLGKEYEVPKKILELNPSHNILKKLFVTDPDSELQTLIIEQIYDSALLVEGLHPDPSSMAPRVQQIIEAALDTGKRQD